MARASSVISVGLSPLARGTQFLFHVINSHSRFIPAGAGNTWKSTVKKSEFPVYPRWRGEHYFRAPPEAICNGLSPLARGTPTRGATQPLSVRFIPAGAGNTNQHLNTLIHDPVYPRWRGEHAGQTGNDCDVRRFIPAGAGNTHNDTNNIRSNPVYPRWRGEHSAIWRRIRRPCGLSPLARGTLTTTQII